MHSHVGKSLGSCTCSLMRLIVQAPSEAVSGQCREDLSVLFLHSPRLGRAMCQPEMILGTRRMRYVLPRSWLETSAQEMSLTPGQVQNSFLSSTREPASHIPKVASGRKKRKQQKKERKLAVPPPLPPQFSFQIHPEQLPAATGNPSQSGKVYCKLKTTACQSKEMFLSTERGIPLWGVGKRALSTSSKLLTHKSTSVPLNRNSCKCPRVS